jgi:hypothetical protein
MKHVFAIMVCIHAIMHLIGFGQAFYFSDVSKQALGISKPIGALWLLTFMLFTATLSAFLNNKRWFYIAFAAIVLSQILILLEWKDAKFGSIVNFIILLMSLSAFGNYRFQKMVQKESKDLLEQIHASYSIIITKKDLVQVPEIIQRWLSNSGVVGTEKIAIVQLKQKGLLRTKPTSKWVPFVATQIFNAETPAFIWSTKLEAMPLLETVGRDKFVNGQGEMLIKLAALIPVVNERDNEKIDQGTMIRFLSELCWFPSAALNDYVSWESIDETSAKATFTMKNKSVSVIFKFSEEGKLVAIEAQRYFGGKKDATLEKWLVEIMDYKVFNGIEIPNKCRVIWKLKDGDFNWLNLEITDLEYNQETMIN